MSKVIFVQTLWYKWKDFLLEQQMKNEKWELLWVSEGVID